MLVMALPLCALFMVSVYVVKFVQRKNKVTDLVLIRNDDSVSVSFEPEAIPYSPAIEASDDFFPPGETLPEVEKDQDQR
jgi:hypothetical protein